MSRQAWLTENSIPSGRVDYVLNLPDDESWRASFLGAFLLLTKEENWEQFETLTPTQMADEWLDIFLDFEQGVFAMVPIGVVLPFAGSGVPGGWLLCDASEVSRTTYAALFAVIGTAYGAGNGSTTFELPDFRSRVPLGLNIADADFNALGDFGGQKEVTLEVSEMPAHTHVQNAHTHTQDAHTHTQNAHTHTQNAHDHVIFGQNISAAGSAVRNPILSAGPSNVISQGTIATNQNATPTNQNTTPTNQNTTPTNQATGGDAAHNNLQPYMVVNYIIKT